MYPFIHLRTYSDYSFLRSTLKISEIVSLAISNNMPAVGLTDLCSLSGALEFSQIAAKSGLHPILGCEIKVVYNTVYSNIILIAKNQIGTSNLIKIASMNYIQKDISILPLKSIIEQNEGLILLTGSIVSQTLKAKQNTDEVITTLKEAFKDRLYIEIRRDIPQPEDKLISLAYSYDIPLVATNPVFFSNKDMYQAYQTLRCIAENKYLSDYEHNIQHIDNYFKSIEEMKYLFSDIPEAVENSCIIAQRCSALLEAIPHELPVFSNNNEAEEIKDKAHTGLQERFSPNKPPEQYIERLEYELNIINNMNYAGYFLIVSDFICWSKASNITVGPGRGSGVGSLVAWSLKITEPDPLQFGLLFERFLNPNRISMPDFDVDFCQEKRELVINYIQEKYIHVAHIIAFGKLQPRAVLRDVARTLQIPYKEADNICKMIPHNAVNPISLSDAIQLDERLQQEQKNSKTIDTLIQISLKLEGLYRHASIHAAGIIISNSPINSSIPVYKSTDTPLSISQYSMKYVGEAGLVKFDFLGLKTLTVISKTLNLIKDTFDISRIPLDDKQTYALLSEGLSIGIFQLENSFMKSSLKQLKPDSIDDIIALISLNRPGPMSNINIYIDRKHGKEKIEYLHPLLEKVLKNTFGVIIYQEQVMEIAQTMGGYSLGEADILRRAMGKKIQKEMAQQKEKFIDGAISNKIERDLAETIFEQVAKFAGYGFNKSHAVAYAMISYQTAYLKTHYPVAFITALLNIDINDTDKLLILCQDASRCNIQILPPDINESQAYFTISGKSIRYALGAIKGVGTSAVEKLASHKHKNIYDFFENNDPKTLNSKMIENLIKAGSFDNLNPNRNQLYQSIDVLMKHAIDTKKHALQNSLFPSHIRIPLKDCSRWSQDEISAAEFDALGLYLFNNPLEKYRHLMQLYKKSNFIICIITNIRMRSSSRGKFAICQVANLTESLSVIFYDENILNNPYFSKGNTVVIKGDNNMGNIIGKMLIDIDHFTENALSNVTLLVQSDKDYQAIRTCLSPGGKTEVSIIVEENKKRSAIILPAKYNLSIEDIEKYQLKLVPRNKENKRY